MKPTLRVFTLLILVLLAQDALSIRYLKIQAEFCIRAFDLNPENIFETHSNMNRTTNNDDYDVFMECYWKRIGFLTREGSLDYMAIWQTYFKLFRKRFDYGESKKRLENLIARCEKVTGNSTALRAINMNNCLSESV